ncbi:hypothetical protein [Plantactinospora sp. CA-290183]|uniref:hypothetical protein n=1 Tax=Plantactinospora sp. CA-290183 TaxID=3240006 RepID=UPI003D8AA32E
MTDEDRHVWRDEERLPLSELERAVARSPVDGQADDVTGNDAGLESAFGHGPEADEQHRPGSESTDNDRDDERDPQATDPQRRYRPSTTGRTGPDTL